MLHGEASWCLDEAPPPPHSTHPEPEKDPPGGRPSAALTKEQRADAGALADLVREGGVVGALVQELAALLRLRSAGEESAVVRADLEALLGSPLPSKGPMLRGTPARTVSFLFLHYCMTLLSISKQLEPWEAGQRMEEPA